jgi:hypothetical protein
MNGVPKGMRASLCAALVALGAGACDTADHGPAQPPSADAAMVVAAAVGAAAAAAAHHPLCDAATFDEVQAVIGGHIAKLDVVDDAMQSSVDCIYLDPQDYFNGLTIRFVSTERLIATASKWRTAGEYYAEWGRGGEPVTALGDGAAWVDLTSGLLVYHRNHALHFSASKADLADAAVRARFEALARRVVARLP